MRTLVYALTGCLLLAGCAHTPSQQVRSALAQWTPSPNYDARRPLLIVLHATEQQSAQQSLHTLRTRNSAGPVSAHYLIGEDGHIYQLVADDARAWHAGGGSWGTIHDVNNASIGIELDNDGSEAFSAAQIDALVRLLQDLTTRWRIPATQIIGHADMAPWRKRDPSARFPWKRLYDAGFGVWPAADAPPAPDGFDAWQALRVLGYPLRDPAAAARAFHRRFRGIDEGDNPSAALDAEDARILHALAGSMPTRPD